MGIRKIVFDGGHEIVRRTRLLFFQRKITGSSLRSSFIYISDNLELLYHFTTMKVRKMISITAAHERNEQVIRFKLHPSRLEKKRLKWNWIWVKKSGEITLWLTGGFYRARWIKCLSVRTWLRLIQVEWVEKSHILNNILFLRLSTRSL